MKVAPWLNRLQNRLSQARHSCARRRNRSQRPIQKLEDRTLLSVEGILIGTDLQLFTTDGEDITVQQDLVTGNVQVLANGAVSSATPGIAASPPLT